MHETAPGRAVARRGRQLTTFSACAPRFATIRAATEERRRSCRREVGRCGVVRRRPSFALVVVAAVTLSVTATACDPPPPPVIVIRADAGTGADAVPGDGVCATATGGCGLNAAIDEANALTPLGAEGPVAVIEVPGLPQAWYPITRLPTVITGNIRIVDDDQWFTQVTAGTFHVAAGARLEMEVDLVNRAQGCGVPCPPLGETKFDVDGTLVLRNTSMFDGGFHYVRVNPGGVAVLDRVSMTGSVWMDAAGNDGSQAILNRGTLLLHSTGVRVGGVLGSVTTLDEGVTYMSRSTITAPERPALGGYPAWPAGAGDACGGTPPISLGGNRAFDETCHLTGPGDVNG
jgi:hypothetical protein